MLQPFLEVFAGLTLDQLLKGFPHGFVPRKLTNHYKRDFFIPVSYTHLDVYKRQLRRGIEVSDEVEMNINDLLTVDCSSACAQSKK